MHINTKGLPDKGSPFRKKSVSNYLIQLFVNKLIPASVVIILGVGMETSGIAIPIGDYTLPGMATSTLVGILMNLVLPRPKEQDAS